MNRLFFAILSFLLIPILSFAQMKLNISTEFTGENQQFFLNNQLESNLKLDMPADVTAPASMKDFYKGLIILGFLADVSFPMGSDDGFKHVAGTAFSGHVVAGYLVSKSFLVALKAGYIKFGTQTEEGEEQGYTYSYEDSYSQIPILIGGFYLFETNSAFKPYLGASVGVFLQTYSVKWEESGFGYDFNLDESFSNTGFGVVPAVGFYYLLGSVILQAGVEYPYIFSDGPTVEYTYEIPEGSLSKISGIAQEEDEESTEKASYISVNLGLSFPLGGN
jgi:outer membrane protein W